MVYIDRANTVLVGLDLYTVAERHQSGLVEAIVQEQIKIWKSNPYFVSASVHQSLDGVRAFTYSQWQPTLDHRSLGCPTIFGEFFPPDSLQLEVSASRSVSAGVEIVIGDHLTHYNSAVENAVFPELLAVLAQAIAPLADCVEARDHPTPGASVRRHSVFTASTSGRLSLYGNQPRLGCVPPFSDRPSGLQCVV